MRRGKRAGAGAALLRDTMELSFPTLMGFVARIPFAELGQRTAEWSMPCQDSAMTKTNRQNKILVPGSMKGLLH